MITVSTAISKSSYLAFPPLPTFPSTSDPELQKWYGEYRVWYEDLQRLLQRDREEILAKIADLS